MNKVHWRIRLDTWLGNLIYRASLGRFDEQVKIWYERKYPRL